MGFNRKAPCKEVASSYQFSPTRFPLLLVSAGFAAYQLTFLQFVHLTATRKTLNKMVGSLLIILLTLINTLESAGHDTLHCEQVLRMTTAAMAK